MTKPVSIQQRIRILDAQGVSWREIARRLGVSRDTVRKYATMEDCSPKPAVRKGRRSLIDAYSGTVDSWLFADRLMPRKQRHTARRVYARLVEEEGFEGSYSSVQRYVKRWREEHRSDGDGYLELDWSAGVMQVDFGEAVATIGGGDVKVHCLVATFPHSNMRYVAAMPGENAECVCEGLARIFDHIGMVPRVLVLDNATGAGHRVAWNKVTVVRVFAMFCDHYRLETRFCNPYSGNEKGSVENAVGFLRRNLMVPKPNAESHRQPARHPLSRCDAIADVDHYRSGRPIRELFDEDRGEMQPLPRARFDAVEWVERKADKEGNIQIGSVRYLAGPSWRGWTLLAGLRAFEVEIRTADGRHVNTLPRSYGDGGRTVRNPATLLPALARKPNAWGESPCAASFRTGSCCVSTRGPRIKTTRADAPAQGRRGERLRERGPRHGRDRGGRPWRPTRPACSHWPDGSRRATRPTRTTGPAGSPYTTRSTTPTGRGRSHDEAVADHGRHQTQTRVHGQDDGRDHGTRQEPAPDQAGARGQPGDRDPGPDGVHALVDERGAGVEGTVETRASAQTGRTAGRQGTRRLRLDAGPLPRRLRARGVGIVGLRRQQRGRGAVRPARDRQDASRGRAGP